MKAIQSRTIAAYVRGSGGSTIPGTDIALSGVEALAGSESASGVLVSSQDNGGSGDLVHGETFEVTGSGFGSKSSNTLVWDNCSHGEALSNRWSRWWPDESTADYNLNYRTPAALGRSVALPHSRITAYLCGAHYADGQPSTSASEWNVAVWRSFTRPSLPYYSVWSWYERVDPNWVFGLSGTPDDNYKFYGYSNGNSIYEFPNNWYFAAVAAVGSAGEFDNATESMSWLTGDDAGGSGLSWHGFVTEPDGHGGVSHTNPASAWIKREMVVRWDDSSGLTGSIQTWTDCVETFNRSGGYTDNYAGTTRSEGIGGYARSDGDPNNWRYFADIYYDRGSSPGRFFLANNATFDSATIREPQSYGSWSSTSVTLTCNGGALSAGTVHLHFRDEVNGHQYIGERTLAA